MFRSAALLAALLSSLLYSAALGGVSPHRGACRCAEADRACAGCEGVAATAAGAARCGSPERRVASQGESCCGGPAPELGLDGVGGAELGQLPSGPLLNPLCDCCQGPEKGLAGAGVPKVAPAEAPRCGRAGIARSVFEPTATAPRSRTVPPSVPPPRIGGWSSGRSFADRAG